MYPQFSDKEISVLKRMMSQYYENQCSFGTSSNIPTWGTIAGSIGDQTDLSAALSSKIPLTGSSSLSGDFLPTDTNTSNLGSSTKSFLGGHFRDIYAYNRITSTAITEQLRLAYDANDYLSFTVNSTGTTTLQPTGTNAGINLNTTGTGVIGLGGNLVPSSDNTIQLGSISNRLSNIFSASSRIDFMRPFTGNGSMVFTNTTGTQGAKMFNTLNWVFGTSSVDNGNKLTVEGVMASTGNIGAGTTSPTHALTFPASSTGIAIHNQADQTVNTETGVFNWDSNILYLGARATGTATNRNFRVGTFTASQAYINFLGQGSGGITSVFSSGSSGSAMFNFTGTLTHNTSVTGFGLRNIPVIAQGGTAGYIANYTSVYEQFVGSGPKLLIDLGVNSSSGGSSLTHTSRFSVDNTGKTTASSDVEVTDSAKGLILKTPDGRRYRITIGDDAMLALTLL